MLETVVDNKLATREEVETALASLRKHDLILLGKWARHYVRGVPLLDPDDLLHMAIVSVLQGGEEGKTRKWPKSTKFMTFLSNVMRSIVSSQRRSYVKLLSKTVLLEDVEASLAVESHESAIIRYYEIEDELALIHSLFKDDAEGKTILEFILDGASKAKILKKTGMTETRYESTRKRIRRKIEQLNIHRRI